MSPPLPQFKLSQPVICPSCAGTVSIMTPESFTLRPNNKFRGHLNALIVDLRNFTRGLDAYLAVHTTSLPLHDIYGTPYARAEILSLINLNMIESSDLMDNYPDPGVTQRFPDAVEAYIESQNDTSVVTRNIFKDALQTTYKDTATDSNLKSIHNAHGEFEKRLAAKAPGDTTLSWTIPKVRIWSEYFESQIDTHDFAQNFADLKAWPKNNSDLLPDQARVVAKLLLGVGLERRVNGLVFDLALEQPAMRDFLRVGMSEATSGLISAVLDVIRPCLNSFYKKLDAALNLQNQDGQTFTEEERLQIADNIGRARLLLLLLHGHAWRCLPDSVIDNIERVHGQSLTEEFRSLFLGNSLWVVDEKTVIRPQLLSRMLNARHFFEDSNLALGAALDAHASKLKTGPTSLLDRLRAFFFSAFRKRTSADTSTQNSNVAWLEHIDKIINVHCNSEIETKKDYDTSTGREASFVQIRKGVGIESKVVFSSCDYQITNEKTFSVVILGSMGSGKSCAFNSAIATMWRYSESLFLDVEPTDAESLLKMERIRDDHLKGEIDLPTDRNFTLNLKVSGLPDASQHSSRVSILDIPGETPFSLISGSGADSELRRIMKSANAVVFLYDLWSDTAFSADVRKSSPEAMKGAIENSLHVSEVRKERQGTAVDQRTLLQKLYGVLREERTEKELREIPFVCVFPKADFLYNAQATQSPSPYILNEFVKDLKDAGIFVESHHVDTSVPRGFRSCAGLKPKPEKLQALLGKYFPAGHSNFQPFLSNLNPKSLREMVEYQLGLAELLSGMFENVVFQKLQDMVGQRQPAEQLPFTSRVQSGVFEFLRKRFNRCYFLPASALGRSPRYDASSQKFLPLGQMPDCQLIEYTMLIPILASIRESLGTDETVTQTTTDSGDNSVVPSEAAAGSAQRGRVRK